MTAPKPTPHYQCWQVQDLTGRPIPGEEYRTEAEARTAALRARVALQRPVRVRRTS